MFHATLPPDFDAPAFMEALGLSCAGGRAYGNAFRKIDQPLVLNISRVGDGKTKEMIELVHGLVQEKPGIRICIMANTVQLCHQICAKLQGLGISAAVWQGKTPRGDNDLGASLCKWPEHLELVQKSGGDTNRLCKAGDSTCEFADTCAIYQQRLNAPQVQLCAHAMMHHPMPGRGRFDLVFYDEDIIGTLVQKKSASAQKVLIPGKAASREKLNEFGKGASGETLDEIRKQLLTAILKVHSAGGGQLPLDGLPGIGEVQALSDTYYRMLDRPRVKPQSTAAPGAANDELKRLRELHHHDGPLLQAVEILGLILINYARVQPGERHLPGLWVYEDDGECRIKVSALVPPRKEYQTKSVLLSATSRPDLYEHIFRDVMPHRSEPRPAPHGRYIRVASSGSKRSLYDDREDRLKPAALDVAEVVNTLARQHHDEAHGETDVLLVAQKAIEERLQPSLDNTLRIATGHFNAMEGLNRFENVRAEIIVGRPLPRIEDLQPDAEAITGRSIRPQGHWDRVSDRAVAKDGKEYETVDFMHQNAVMHDLLRTTCHGQVAQADRTRAQWREADRPVDVYVMNQLDLGVEMEFDTAISLEALLGWYPRMVARGIVPDFRASDGADRGVNQLVATVLHDVFKDAEAARQHRKQRAKSHGETRETLRDRHGFKTPRPVNIELPGERYKSRALIDAASRAEAELKIEQLKADGRLPEGAKIKHPRAKRRKT